MIAALITLFIPNTVDHPVNIFSLIIGVWCKQDGDTGYWIKDLHKCTAQKAHLFSLGSPLNVAPCATKFKTCTQQTQTSCFDSLMATAVAPHRS